MENVKKEAAIVTGASSGIGYAISRKLSALGYDVFGFGRDFGKVEWKAEDNVYPIVCDVLDTDKLCACIRQIAAQHQVRILVNNAGVGYYGLHEELSPDKIKKLVRTNLETPMILTQQLLRHLKKNAGYVINISSVTAGQSNPHGCAYGAVKAGLASFSHSLFDEARKYGVKVITIFPDMTQTNLYRNADFREGDETESYLLPEDVANAVEWILGQREGVVVTDITLKPQLHRIKRKTSISTPLQ
ncbi:MAG: SDR family oxidoreductase [Lachnospiraceae bacterium]|nr:SDR family oxidoreductase [Lachnospiraceae bacterium]MDE7417892.1 SDR family oxidoreductase [Lachnospiraceae bacterium]